MSVSRESVNRVGWLLRDGALEAGTPAWSVYEEFLNYCDTQRAEVASQVAELVAEAPTVGDFDSAGRITVSSRTKTTKTIREKLTRMGNMELIRLDDIAGVRVVGDVTLDTQTRLADALAKAFHTAPKIKDYRPGSNSVHGYRALHVIVRHGGIHVEIQLRTWLQAKWAEFFERLSDRWGRQIRYGHPPDPDGSGCLDRRQDFISRTSAFALSALVGYEEHHPERDLATVDPVLAHALASTALRRSSRAATGGQTALIHSNFNEPISKALTFGHKSSRKSTKTMQRLLDQHAEAVFRLQSQLHQGRQILTDWWDELAMEVETID